MKQSISQPKKYTGNLRLHWLRFPLQSLFRKSGHAAHIHGLAFCLSNVYKIMFCSCWPTEKKKSTGFQPHTPMFVCSGRWEYILPGVPWHRMRLASFNTGIYDSSLLYNSSFFSKEDIYTSASYWLNINRDYLYSFSPLKGCLLSQPPVFPACCSWEALIAPLYFLSDLKHLSETRWKWCHDLCWVTSPVLHWKSLFSLSTVVTALRVLFSGPRTTGTGWSLPAPPSCGFLMQLRIRLLRPLSTKHWTSFRLSPSSSILCFLS